MFQTWGSAHKKKLGEKEEKEENFSIHTARVLFLSSLSRKKGPDGYINKLWNDVMETWFTKFFQGNLENDSTSQSNSILLSFEV